MRFTFWEERCGSRRQRTQGKLEGCQRYIKPKSKVGGGGGDLGEGGVRRLLFKIGWSVLSLTH